MCFPALRNQLYGPVSVKSGINRTLPHPIPPRAGSLQNKTRPPVPATFRKALPKKLVCNRQQQQHFKQPSLSPTLLTGALTPLPLIPPAGGTTPDDSSSTDAENPKKASSTNSFTTIPNSSRPSGKSDFNTALDINYLRPATTLESVRAPKALCLTHP
jgi:hypothetical protein